MPTTHSLLPKSANLERRHFQLSRQEVGGVYANYTRRINIERLMRKLYYVPDAYLSFRVCEMRALFPLYPPGGFGISQWKIWQLLANIDLRLRRKRCEGRLDFCDRSVYTLCVLPVFNKMTFCRKKFGIFPC